MAQLLITKSYSQSRTIFKMKYFSILKPEIQPLIPILLPHLSIILIRILLLNTHHRPNLLLPLIQNDQILPLHNKSNNRQSTFSNQNGIYTMVTRRIIWLVDLRGNYRTDLDVTLYVAAVMARFLTSKVFSLKKLVSDVSGSEWRVMLRSLNDKNNNRCRCHIPF